MKFAPAAYIGTLLIPVNFGDDGDDVIWIQIPDHFDFLETTWQILMKFAPAAYIGTWMIPVDFGDDGDDDCGPDLDPDSGSL